MKKVFIIAGSIILFIGLLMAGCKALINTVANATDCERFNIDGIEVRTGIDIPAITNVDCIYVNGVKNVTFILDTSKVDIAHYLDRNKFIKKDSVYLNQGNRERTEWYAEFNEEFASLKMKIIYKDVIEKS